MALQPFSVREPLSDEEIFRGKLKKLLFYRLILAVLLLLLTIAVESRKEDLLSAHLRPFYLFSCILFIFTIIGALGLERVRKLVRFAWLQLLFDIGAVTVLVYFSGGVDSPFSFLYILVVISSALLLFRRGSLLTASMCSVVYGTLLDLQFFELIHPLNIASRAAVGRESGNYFLNILANIACFYLVGFLAGYLAEELYKSGEQVREHAREFHQLSTLHRSIVQSMTSGLLTIDSEDRIVFLNNAGQDILGVRREDITGRRVEKLIAGLDIARLREPAPPGARGRCAPHTRMEVLYKSPSGQEIHLGYSVSVLQSQDGEPFGWVLIFTDLTQLKEIEEHMQRTERLAFAGRIASEIAHEIKNPLAAMSGAVQMLQGELGPDPFQSRLTGIVEREIKRINELVTDFLWLSRGFSKSEHPEEVAVCATIQDILSLLKAKNQVAESHLIRTSFEAFPSLDIDPHHLRQILWNLLINGLEAMPEGGELFISVRPFPGAEPAAWEARIDIADTGCGIAETARKRIFDPFFTTKATGTGLGLSIVYQLVERAGGWIEANPNPSGRGTIFSIFFQSAKYF